MTKEEFNILLEQRFEKTRKTFSKKQPEYATEDVLHNFKRAGILQNINPPKALLGMLSKHLVSVLDIIEQNKLPAQEVIDEKIGDTINYFILLECLYADYSKPLLKDEECTQNDGQ